MPDFKIISPQSLPEDTEEILDLDLEKALPDRVSGNELRPKLRFNQGPVKARDYLYTLSEMEDLLSKLGIKTWSIDQLAADTTRYISKEVIPNPLGRNTIFDWKYYDGDTTLLKYDSMRRYKNFFLLKWGLAKEPAVLRESEEPMTESSDSSVSAADSMPGLNTRIVTNKVVTAENSSGLTLDENDLNHPASSVPRFYDPNLEMELKYVGRRSEEELEFGEECEKDAASSSAVDDSEVEENGSGQNQNLDVDVFKNKFCAPTSVEFPALRIKVPTKPEFHMAPDAVPNLFRNNGCSDSADGNLFENSGLINEVALSNLR